MDAYQSVITACRPRELLILLIPRCRGCRAQVDNPNSIYSFMQNIQRQHLLPSYIYINTNIIENIYIYIYIRDEPSVNFKVDKRATI